MFTSHSASNRLVSKFSKIVLKFLCQKRDGQQMKILYSLVSGVIKLPVRCRNIKKTHDVVSNRSLSCLETRFSDLVLRSSRFPSYTAVEINDVETIFRLK